MATAAELGLSRTQYRNALGIISAVKKDARFRSNPQKAAAIAIETALTESGMRMIASANVPASQKFAHELLSWTDDGLGHDHASCGMFQQQTGTHWTPAGFGSHMNQTTMNSPDGWGPPSVLMNAEKSTTLFLNALAQVDWQDVDNWVAAQAVQHSAFADGANYRTSDPAARRIVSALWDVIAPAGDDEHQLSGEDDMKIVQNADKTAAALLLGQGARPIVLAGNAGAARRNALIAAGIPVVEIHDPQYQALRTWADSN